MFQASIIIIVIHASDDHHCSKKDRCRFNWKSTCFRSIYTLFSYCEYLTLKQHTILTFSNLSATTKSQRCFNVEAWRLNNIDSTKNARWDFLVNIVQCGYRYQNAVLYFYYHLKWFILHRLEQCKHQLVCYTCNVPTSI